MTGRRWELLIPLFCLLLAVVVGGWRSGLETRKRLREAREWLREEEARGTPRRFFQAAARPLVDRLLGRRLTENLREEVRRFRRQMRWGRAEVYLFDRAGELIDPRLSGYSSPPEVVVEEARHVSRTVAFRDYWRTVLMFLRVPFGQSLGEAPPMRNRESSFRKNASGQPRRVAFFRPEKGMMGIWDFHPEIAGGRVAGVIVLFAFRPGNRGALNRHLASTLRRQGHTVYFRGSSGGPADRRSAALSEAYWRALSRRFSRRMGEVFPWRNGQLVCHACPGDDLLAVLVANRPWQADPIFLFAAYFLGFLLWRWRVVGDLERPPAWLFSVGLVLGAAGLPLLISGFLWAHLEENRRKALMVEEIEQAEDLLVTMDRSFFTVHDEQRAIYRQWSDRFERAFRAQGASGEPDETLGLSRYFQAPLPGTALFSLLEESKTMEMDRQFDSLFLVASTGVFLRPFSLERDGIRKLFQFRGSERQAYLEALSERGKGIPLPLRLFHLAHPDRSLPWKDWCRLGGAMDGKKARMLAESLTELLRRFNEQNGYVPSRPGFQRDAMGLVMDSLEEFFGFSLEKWINVSLGEILSFQKEDSRTAVWMNVVRGASGAGEILMVFYHSMCTLETLFLERLQNSGRRLPGGRRWMAVGLAPEARSFPRPLLHRILEPFTERIVPPRAFWHGIVRIREEPYLLSLLRGPRLMVYHLGLICPLKGMIAREAAGRKRMALLGLMMGFLLVVLVGRLRAGILLPVERLMRGVQAMEARRYDFRVAMETGDEWEAVASAFNASLEGLADLALAGVVQQKLLPAADVTSPGWVFRGRSAMMETVGGDYYDALPMTGEKLAFIFGDVSGHGVAAALVMAMAKSGFASQIALGQDSPARLLEDLNRLFLRTIKKRMAMTCLVGMVDREGAVTMAVAGQIPPLVDGSATGLPVVPPCPPLGMPWKKAPDEVRLALVPGNSLVFYSDGAVFLEDPAGEYLGFARFEAAVGQNGPAHRPEFLERMEQTFRVFSGAAPRTDDVTLAVLSRVP